MLFVINILFQRTADFSQFSDRFHSHTEHGQGGNVCENPKKIRRSEMLLCIDVCVVDWWLLASRRSRISYVITSSCNPKPNAEYVWMNHVPFHIYVHGLFNSLGTGLMSLSRYVPQCRCRRTNSKCVGVICVYIRFQWTCYRTVIYHFSNANQILNRPNW